MEDEKQVTGEDTALLFSGLLPPKSIKRGIKRVVLPGRMLFLRTTAKARKVRQRRSQRVREKATTKPGTGAHMSPRPNRHVSKRKVIFKGPK